MNIEEIVKRRGITEILHFTTNQGLVGVLHSGAIKSRARLEKDQQLEFIFSANASLRKDPQWLDYVNLSISRINSEFFEKSNRWHSNRDIWWCVLSFDPIILGHEGVYFTTTNNIYSGVRRALGAEGLNAMFADRVLKWQGNPVSRDAQTSLAFPTCLQAEVLYPRQLSSGFLQRVYVAREEDLDEVHGQLEALGHREVAVSLSPQVFGSVG